MSDRPWLVTYRSKRSGATHRRRFYSKWDAVQFMEYDLFGIHPSDKTLSGPDAPVRADNEKEGAR